MLLAISVASFAFLLIGFCAGIIRPSRPLFANRYAIHPDGRPPWPRWWIDPPEVDRTGTSFRVDHSLSLVILYVASDPEISLFYGYPGHHVFDEQGQHLHWNQSTQTYPVVLNTLNIQEARNRLFVVDREGRWHEFELPSGFAKGLEDHFDDVDRLKEHHVLEGCRRFAENQEVQGLAEWLADQTQRSPQPGE